MVGAMVLTMGMFLVDTEVDVGRYSHHASAYTYNDLLLPLDSPEIDLPYPINDGYDPFGSNQGIIDLEDPPNIESGAEYDPASGEYFLYQNVGDQRYRNPSAMSESEFLNYSFDDALQENWTQIVTEQNESEQEESSEFGTLAPSLKIDSEVFDRIFGGNTIDIKPQGTAELSFGINRSKTENPRIPERQRTITTFDFDQQIQLNLLGSIGDKMNLNFNYNTEASFDFENKIKLQYEGKEDEIIKLIEAGDVSLPLTGSLITGSQTLFGLKTKLKFGRLTATSVFSQERGQRKEINVSGGAQTQNFEIEADDYEANRHYFVNHYFQERYNQSMQSLPVVNSQAYITRIEVWITNNRASFEENRNMVAFADLGEDASIPFSVDNSNITPGYQPLDRPGIYPDNGQNNIYDVAFNTPGVRTFQDVTGTLSALGMTATRHFEEVESARKLTQNEYTFNPKLGFISLNQSLNNDEVLAVAYQYTLNGQTFQVGDFSTDGIDPPDALFLKLLKATITNPKLPIWDLMMKNVYSMGAFQVNSENFRADVWYNDPLEGYDIPFIPQEGIDGVPLIQLIGMDRIDQNTNSTPDGVFDYVDNAATQGGTINARNGRIFFSTTEPFGETVAEEMAARGVSNALIDGIAYYELYDSTQTAARQIPEKNRFKLKGTYQSASSDEISLNAINVPQGSVQVTAGGVQLVENVDYTVDYNLGRVKILNSGLIESQTPIKISLESNSLFSIQTKTLLGTRFDYEMNNDLLLGATIMNLTERPITQKINFGEEPISNTIVGLDAAYQTESPFVTKLVDKLPFYGTKETSNVNLSAEAAYLIPGHSKAITKEGVSYIDDFEGSQSTIDLRNFSQWRLASTPQNIPFAESVNDLRYGFRRAYMSWYVIDPLFYRDNNLTPDNVASNNDMQSDHRMREVFEREVFPNRELAPGTPNNIPTLDLTFYPNERGPYNFNNQGEIFQGTRFNEYTQVESNFVGLDNASENWAGIMRSLTTTDFEQSNIEFVQFWLMDPFHEDSENSTGGDLYLNLGNISEDILRDSRKFFENGLPSGPDDQVASTETTEWSVVPTTQAIVNAFDNTTDSNAAQDLGYDGMDDALESDLRQDFINSLPPEVLDAVIADPANDNYRYFRGEGTDNLDVLERYKRYNQSQGNSVTSADSPNDFPSQASTLPTTEDVNQDQNLSKNEAYFEYKVHLEPNMQIGGYITDKFETFATTENGSRNITWYQFKIPVQDLSVDGARRVNDIQDFRSIRFFRMFMQGWTEEVTLRFARLELVRGEWRRYTQELGLPGEGPIGEPGNTLFNIAAVNIEENGNRDPINYVLPPGIQREVNTATANLANLNEQSLSLEVCDLQDGDARAAFRNVQVDMRSYKKLKMFIHAEGSNQFQDLRYGDISVFIRLGSDFNQNYYEYEIPVHPTEWGAALGDDIWPGVNDMEIELADLLNAKAQRNNAGIPVNQIYEVNDDDRRIKVVGNPVLSAVRTIMVGIRNPQRTPEGSNSFFVEDLGTSMCAEVWVNELRLADFDQRGGWAAIARMSTQLADLGNLSVAGNYSTPGFGSIEKKVSERQRETIRGIDASSNIELGKFLPEESGVKVPMYLGYSETISDPQFDPLSPDLETNQVASDSNEPNYKQRRRTYTRRRSLNFTNVRKERSKDAKGSPKPYSISNFTVSYSYSEFNSYDINTSFNNNKTYNGGLTYNYSPKPLEVKPFSSIGFIKKSKWLGLIKDFNFNIGPRQLAFRTDVTRTYQEYQARNNLDNEFFTFEPPPQFTKTFNWQRVYDLKYDLTKSLKLNFTANNFAIIGEPAGRVDREYRDDYEAFKDSVWTNIQRFGETTDYNHNFNLTYKLPLDKLPLTDWITVNTGYSGTYNWLRAPFSQDTLGHTIQNSRNINVNAQVNMVNLYNKVPFLKEANKKVSRSRGRGGKGKDEKEGKEGKDGKEGEDDKGKGRKKDDASFNLAKETAKFLMMLKNISVTYNQTEGTLLPGYGRETNVLGFDNQFAGPGLGFIVGFQDEDYPFEAARRGYLVESPYINNPYTNTYATNLNIRANLEPIKSFRIELTATRTESSSRAGFFRYSDEIADYVNNNPLETGTYSASVITWGSAFAKDDENSFASEVFQTFLDNRAVISGRVAASNPFSEASDQGYFSGYDSTSQDVVIPAFIAAYTDTDPGKVKLNPLSVVPMPNWRITYDGLSKNKKLKKIFRSVTISHAYRSTYSVGTYTTNLQYEEIDGQPAAFDQNGNYIPQLQIGSISISEQLSPLINVDMTWKNSLITKVEIRRNRTLSFTLSNYQLTENKSNELILGGGYRFQDVKFPFKLGKSKRPTSDMNIRADLSIRDNITLTRSMNERTNIPASGQRVFSLKTSADYTLNRSLSLRAFYDHQINNPKVSLSFPTSNINAGIALRFTLAQ